MTTFSSGAASGAVLLAQPSTNVSNATVANIQSFLSQALAGDATAVARLQALAQNGTALQQEAANRALAAYTTGVGSFNQSGLGTDDSLSSDLQQLFQPSLDNLATVVAQKGAAASNALATQISPKSQTTTGQLKLAVGQVSPWVWVGLTVAVVVLAIANMKGK